MSIALLPLDERPVNNHHPHMPDGDTIGHVHAPPADRLPRHSVLSRLVAYSSWNTAGNTIGAARAQDSVAYFAAAPEQKRDPQHLLGHRFLETWSDQHLDGEQRIAVGLQNRQRALTRFAEQIAAGSTVLPKGCLSGQGFQLAVRKGATVDALGGER